LPDVFTALDSIARRALGLVPRNSYVRVRPLGRILNVDRAVEELARGWLEGLDLLVEEVYPPPQRIALEKLLREFAEVLNLVEREGIASIELAYAVARSTAALCVALGVECAKSEEIRRGRAIARIFLEAALGG